MKNVLTLLPERGGRKAKSASKNVQLKRVRASDGSMVGQSVADPLERFGAGQSIPN
jgi:hypothetical protein